MRKSSTIIALQFIIAAGSPNIIYTKESSEQNVHSESLNIFIESVC